MGLTIGNYIGIGKNSGKSYWATRTPSALTLTVLSDTSIKVDWTNAGTGFDGHSVERSDDGITYTEIDTVLIGTNTLTDTGLTNGSTYYYRVRAYSGTNYSNYATPDSVTISTLLSNLVFSLKWDGSQFINAVTGLALVDHGSVAAGTPIVANSEIPGTFVAAKNKYLSTPDTADLSMGDTDFMIAAWINVTSLGAIQILASKSISAGGKREWALWTGYSALNKVAFTVSSGGDTWSGIEGPVILINTDYFILAWYNATADTINIQVNNGTIYSTAHAGGVKESDADLAIGAVANPALYSGGLIGNVDIWKGRLLSAGEKAALWGGGTGNKHPFSSFPSKILLMGDKSGSEDATISQAINIVLMAQNPHIIIGTGDYHGETLTTTQLLTNLTASIFASPGNHDDWVVGTRTEFNAWCNGGGYRKVSIPLVDFFIYDYYLKMDESGYYTLAEAEAITLAARQASTQGQWLINGLASSTAKWKVVVLHNPPWASPSDYLTPNIINEAVNMRWDWVGLGASLIVCGHFHFYERLLKATGSGNIPILMIGNTGTTDSLGWLSVDADSQAIFNEVTDTDFEGGMLVIMTVTDDSLTIDLSAIKADYSVVAGKDQLVLT